jgi:hypothetical protein
MTMQSWARACSAAAYVVGVVECDKPYLVSERIQEDAVLWVQMDDRIDVLANLVGPAMQLPFGRG